MGGGSLYFYTFSKESFMKLSLMTSVVGLSLFCSQLYAQNASEKAFVDGYSQTMVELQSNPQAAANATAFAAEFKPNSQLSIREQVTKAGRDLAVQQQEQGQDFSPVLQGSLVAGL